MQKNAVNVLSNIIKLCVHMHTITTTQKHASTNYTDKFSKIQLKVILLTLERTIATAKPWPVHANFF